MRDSTLITPSASVARAFLVRAGEISATASISAPVTTMATASSSGSPLRAKNSALRPDQSASRCRQHLESGRPVAPRRTAG